MSVNKDCSYCETQFKPARKEQKYCSPNCYHMSCRGRVSPNWKGGRKVNPYGYVELYKPGHPNADAGGYVKEHVFVMSMSIGREISRDEVVHHINENKVDNRIENLKLMTRGEHQRHHNTGRILSRKHREKLSLLKKRLVPLLQRNADGTFKKGVKYCG